MVESHFFRPVGRYQILGGHTINETLNIAWHNHQSTTNGCKYWVGTCPCTPLVPTGLKKFDQLFTRDQLIAFCGH